jgi:hypothetical protein
MHRRCSVGPGTGAYRWTQAANVIIVSRKHGVSFLLPLAESAAMPLITLSAAIRITMGLPPRDPDDELAETTRTLNKMRNVALKCRAELKDVDGGRTLLLPLSDFLPAGETDVAVPRHWPPFDVIKVLGSRDAAWPRPLLELFNAALKAKTECERYDAQYHEASQTLFDAARAGRLAMYGKPRPGQARREIPAEFFGHRLAVDAGSRYLVADVTGVTDAMAGSRGRYVTQPFTPIPYLDVTVDREQLTLMTANSQSVAVRAASGAPRTVDHTPLSEQELLALVSETIPKICNHLMMSAQELTEEVKKLLPPDVDARYLREIVAKARRENGRLQPKRGRRRKFNK